MSEEWFKDLPEDAHLPETDKIYVQSLAKVRKGIAAGLTFDSASAALDIADEEMKKQIIDDILKVFIAEVHFAKNVSLQELGMALHLPVERLEKAREEMLEDIEQSSINAFYDNMEKGTEH